MAHLTSLSEKLPQLAAEWHPTKNSIQPDNVGSGSKQKVWWLGECGHEWESAINSRVAGRGCHYCSGYKSLAGFNDLATTHPELAEQWDRTVNSILPENVSASSHKKVAWVGKCGHSFIATISNRAIQHSGCSVCNGSQVQSGFNDLVTTHPELAAEWHPTKNKNFYSTQLKAGSNRKVWWLGQCGHEWEMGCSARTNQNQGCPYCSGKRVLQGFNDLQTLYPKLMDEWNKKNIFSPSEITSKSAKKAWWVCENNHEWEAAIYSRANGNGCPFCAKKVVTYKGERGTKILIEMRPELVKEWDIHKNLLASINNVSYGSKKLYWWSCEKGHSWEASPLSRAKSNTNCPYCSNKKTLKGFNDLQTVNPELAKEWHPTKNPDLTPAQITSGNDSKVWWLGQCGHEWEAKITGRKSTGCPFCVNNKILLGFNDLATTHPELAAEWHPTKNIITPQMIVGGSFKKVWWICKKEHEWEATCGNRTRAKSGCPQCAADSYVSKAEQTIADYITSLGLLTRTSVRDVIKGELDIYIPEKNIAVEFNGLYWHSEMMGKNKFYHYDKWKDCKEKGIQLIQIWEDEWNRNPEQIKNMVAYKLGATQQRKIPGRKTEVIELTNEKSSAFLDINHIQGAVSGGVRLGLVEKSNPDTVLAVMVLKTESGSEGKILNLLRFATSVSVIGGFTKLLKYAERTFNPDSIITFSDNCVSDGGLYKNNGFVAVKELAPDYRYVVKGERIHKFLYRLKRFRDGPNLQYEEGLSERELALLNNLPRIWDAGKTKWELNLVG